MKFPFISKKCSVRSLSVIIVLICLSLSMNGCGYGDYYSNGFVEDYDLLWQTLEEEYVFFPYIEVNGVDVTQTKKKYREKISLCGSDVALYYDCLNQMFKEMGNIGHLWVLDPYGYEAYRQALMSEWGDFLSDDKVMETYKDLSLASRQTNLLECANVSFKYDEKIKTVIIRIKSFDGNRIDCDHEAIVNYLNLISEKPVENVVFDITGNEGGNSLFWKNNIVSIFGGTYEWMDRVFIRETKLADKYYINQMPFSPISAMEEDSVPEFAKTLKLTHYMELHQRVVGHKEVGDEICYAKRWVLTDGSVFSSAETFVNFCKKTGWATIVGTRTKGDGMGREPILIKLPNSGLLIQFKLMCPENTSGNLDVVCGTMPDYVSMISETPEDTFRRLIMSKQF